MFCKLIKGRRRDADDGFSETTISRVYDKHSWYGHVLRKKDGYVFRKALDIEVEDQRRKERPKRRRRKHVEEECGRFVQGRCVLHRWRWSDCHWVEVNLVTINCLGYYRISTLVSLTHKLLEGVFVAHSSAKLTLFTAWQIGPEKLVGKMIVHHKYDVNISNDLRLNNR